MATITGTNGNDVLRVTPQSDSVYGLDGNDTFYWSQGVGVDRIFGGGSSYDRNIYGEKADGDRLRIEGDAPVKLFFTSTDDGYIKDQLSFTSVERLHTGSGNDLIRAGNATMGEHGAGITVYTGAGNDVIKGSRYDDFIDGGSGNDKIYAGAGNDHVQASSGNDLIYGGAGDDNIRWGQGDVDTGKDTIFGGEGNDLINVWVKEGFGENGEGVAVDVIKVHGGSMKLTAQTDIGEVGSTLQAQGFEQGWTHEGKDTVSGADAEIVGNKGMMWNTRWGDDFLTGTRSNDTLEGGDGRDTIEGGAGNDLISAANDFFMGGNAPSDGDVDTIIFRVGHGNDTVIGTDNFDIIDTGDRDYLVTQTANGELWTLGNDSILFM